MARLHVVDCLDIDSGAHGAEPCRYDEDSFHLATFVVEVDVVGLDLLSAL